MLQAAEPEAQPRQAQEIATYFDLINAVCQQLHSGYPELERRLEWRRGRIWQQQSRRWVPYDRSLPPVCAFVVEETPDLIPLNTNDPQDWLANLLSDERRRKIREARKAGKRLWRKERDKVSRWPRQKLAKEVAGFLTAGISAGLQARMARLDYSRPVGSEGFEIYKDAWLLRARLSRSATHPGQQQHQRTEKWRASRALSGFLKALQSGQGHVFQCQVCGQLCYLEAYAASSYERSGAACGTCWSEYYRQSGYMSWLRSGGRGSPPPPLSKRAGRTLRPVQVRQKLISFLQFRLDRIEEKLIDGDYDAIYDIERRLRESSHPWCQRIITCLDVLRSP